MNAQQICYPNTKIPIVNQHSIKIMLDKIIALETQLASIDTRCTILDANINALLAKDTSKEARLIETRLSIIENCIFGPELSSFEMITLDEKK